MKKNDQRISAFDKNFLKNNKDLKLNKTTNINILLNRVRLDKKKVFKKRIIITSIIISIICTAIFFLF